jgi:hypothetical protein
VQRPATLLPPVAAPLKALVAHGATLSNPRDRAAVLTCWMVARLARLPRGSDFSELEALQQRAEATRRWLATQSLPPAVGIAASRACDAAGEKEPASLADAVDVLRDAADPMLNNAARAELTTLAQMLRRSSLVAMR